MSDSVTNSVNVNGTVVTEPIHDLYLRMLIRVLEKDDTHRSSIPVTFMVNGGIIYGSLISADTWKIQWEEQMQKAEGVGVDVIRNFPRDIDEAFEQAFEEEAAEKPDDDGLRYFVHMKDASLVIPGSAPISLPLWRGRLESVDGWSVGCP